MAVVAVADRIQEGLANCDLTESGNGVHHHAFLKVLLVIPHVHEFPHPVIERQKALPILFTLIGWARSGSRTIFEDDFGLGQSSGRVLYECRAGSEPHR